MRPVEERLRDAFRHACHPASAPHTSVLALDLLLTRAWVADVPDLTARTGARPEVGVDADALVLALYHEHGPSLVRMVRLFVDDRNAAEDLVQEAFIRLARNAHRIDDRTKAAAYLRSIVLNLARDHNRRGLVSLRHHLPTDDRVASTEDVIVVRDDQREVLEALRELPHRQRDCVVLRYWAELGIADIASTLGISENSVKTHLKRALARLESELEDRQ